MNTTDSSRLIVQRLSGAILFLAITSTSWSAEYYVSVDTGSDDNTGGTQATAWRTIQKAADEMRPGDTVYVASGNYRELPSDKTPSTQVRGIKPQQSGTADKPIIYRAEPGVVIDQAGQGPGFYLENREHLEFHGFEIRNVKTGGFLVYGSAHITIQGNHVYNADGDAGDNVALINLNKCNNCEITNNLIYNSAVGGDSRNQNAAGIISFEMLETLIAHNEIYNAHTGVFHKRFKNTGAPGDTGVIVEFNRIYDVQNGVRYSVAGGGDPGHSNQTVRYNVMYNADHCISSTLRDSADSGKGLRVYNNTLVGCDIELYGYEGVEIFNNIFHDADSSRVIFTAWPESSDNRSSITYSDYNVFSPDVSFALNLFGSSEQTFSFSAWQSSGMDTNSVQREIEFVGENVRDYRVSEGSYAHENLGNGRDGEGIGAYPTGDEVVGVQDSNTPRRITDLEADDS